MIFEKFDHMTLDEIDAEIREYKKIPIGKMTPYKSERLYRLRSARARIVGYRVDP